MLRATAGFFVRLVERWMPDPFVIAMLLTMLVFVLAVTLAGQPPIEAVSAWGDSIWDLLAFTMQIMLTLALGHALAHTPPARRLLEGVAGRVKTARGAYLMVCFVGGVTALFSWGLSLVAAAILARTTAENCRRRGILVHYPLLVASGYAGFVLWHQGLSGSIPLAINTPGHFLEDTIGLVSVTQTIFTPWNMGLALFLLISLPFVMSRLEPKASECRPLPDHLDGGDEPEHDPELHAPGTPAAKLEQSPVINVIAVILGLVYLWVLFESRDGSLNLNILNFGFLILGLALSRSPVHYLSLLSNAARVLGPFLIQYPLYAGLMGLMAASGLAAMLVEAFVGVASAQTLPIWAFFSGGILNVFIPSGGGQWAIQGPIVVDAAMQLGADVPRVAMAVALGDQWTNMIQPLFAIPALAIAGLHIRDIMGYCVIALIFSGGVFIAALSPLWG